MKKLLLILIIAALGVGGGMYLASKTDSLPVQEWVKAKTEKSWNITHPKWQGTLTSEGQNRAYLNINGDYATIVSNENGILTVKWDNWGTESFKCDAQNNCTLIQ